MKSKERRVRGEGGEREEGKEKRGVGGQKGRVGTNGGWEGK